MTRLVGLLRPSSVGTLSPSDCYPVGPADPYVAGGPCRPRCLFTNPEPGTHTVLVHADQAGQDVSAVGMSSPPDCYPAGPAGPHVAGGLLGQMIIHKFCNHARNWFWTMLTRPDSMPLFGYYGITRRCGG